MKKQNETKISKAIKYPKATNLSGGIGKGFISILTNIEKIRGFE